MSNPIIVGEVLERIRQLHAAGQSIRTIAVITGFSRSSVHRALQRADQDQHRANEAGPAARKQHTLPVPLPKPRTADSEPGSVPSWLAGRHPMRDEEPKGHPATWDLPGWRRRMPGGPW